MRLRRVITVTAGCSMISSVIFACGSSPAATPRGGQTLEFAVFNPATGADAGFMPLLTAGCFPAANYINANGGVLGDKINCNPIDTRGDPADAVPAADQLIGTASNLVAILGPSSDEADATIPIFERSGIPMFVDTGEPSYSHTTLPYFWRLFPPDDSQGTALVLWAHEKGYTRVGGFFGQDISSQANVPSALRAAAKLGMTMVLNEKLTLDQTSYRTEVAQMVNANPQVLVSEADPQTAATYLSEYQQLHGLIPFIDIDYTLPFRHAIVEALGNRPAAQYYTAVLPYSPNSGAAYDTYRSWLLKAPSSEVTNPKSHLDDTYAERYWDAVTITCLAMVAANSTNPAVFNKFIPKVTTPGTGATVVYNFVQGEQALRSGKSIAFVGAGGTIAFNQWHNSPGAFAAITYSGDPNDLTNHQVGLMSAQEIAGSS